MDDQSTSRASFGSAPKAAPRTWRLQFIAIAATLALVGVACGDGSGLDDKGDGGSDGFAGEDGGGTGGTAGGDGTGGTGGFAGEDGTGGEGGAGGEDGTGGEGGAGGEDGTGGEGGAGGEDGTGGEGGAGGEDGTGGEGGTGGGDPETEKLVFVTSTVHRGDFGGVEGADAICNALASDAELPGTYLAWIAGSAGSPDTRFSRSELPYVRTDGEVIAEGYEDLVAYGPMKSISVDEYGERVHWLPATAWTNVLPDGTIKSESRTCEDWTSHHHAVSYFGWYKKNSTHWTDSHIKSYCGIPRRLYCFQQ